MRNRLLPRHAPGFTLIEAFFVMLLITLFTSFTLGYLQKVRREARDVKRLADIGQVRSALELYEHSHNRYPDGKNILIGKADAMVLDGRGWVPHPIPPIYMNPLPTDPLPDATLPCVKNVSLPCAYSYTNLGNGDFSIRFSLEHGVPPLSAPGSYQLTTRGYRP